MAHIQYTDGLIREYILYRGFSSTLKSFDNELKNDKDKSFRVDKIVDQITHSINTQDLQALRELWSHLNNHLFYKLEHSFTAAVNKLEQSILKLYLVIAYTSNKSDKITEFFNKLASELVSQGEWKEWFFFPFCKNPDEHPVFAVCFTKPWQDTLLISLHNFLATIFQCMPQPTLTRVEAENSFIRKLQEENTLLRTKLQTIQQQAISSSGTHQSRLTTFNDQKYSTDSGNKHKFQRSSSNSQNINDIIPFDIPPPAHIVDDFYIIAQETIHVGNSAESQARGLKSLIRNIGSGGSPVMGRKDNVNDKNNKRSGSVGSRTWIHN